jgi:hypothetical protein
MCAAAVNHILSIVPLYFGGYLRNGVIWCGDKNKLSDIRYLLCSAINFAAAYPGG